MIYPIKTGERGMAAQIHNLKLVSKTKERQAVEHVVDQFRLVYENWDREDFRSAFIRSREESDTFRKDVWMMCVESHDSDTILLAMGRILRGETEFNVTAPTPMQFSELCNILKKGHSVSTYDSDDILDRF
jgi:hypothetical protein